MSRCKCAAWVLWVSAGIVGCVQTLSKDVSLTPEPGEDDEYAHVLEAHSRDAKVFVDFESVVQLSVTHLSAPMRSALAARVSRMLGTEQGVLSEASEQLGFFVSAFVADRKAADLTDDRQWVFTLRHRDQVLRPILVRRLVDKGHWRPFFPAVTEWSDEYLVLFNTNPSDPGSPTLVAPESLTLEVAGTRARVQLAWGEGP